MDILFKTVTGSRLYGLSNADSDYDYFVVVDRQKNAKARYSKQSIKDGIDTVTVDFGTWVNGMAIGVPQYLEACFSQVPEVDRITAFRNSVEVGTGSWDRYLRTIKSSAMQETMKSRRHGIRLAYNMRDLRRYGRFDPHMQPEDIYTSTVIAELNDSQTVYEYALDIAWS